MASWTFALTLSCFALAVLITAFRLFVRGRSRWGWDDFWAATGILTFLTIAIQNVLYTYNFSEIVANHKLMIALFYLTGLAFSIGAWTSRFSILFSLRRMAVAPRTIQILRWATYFFYFGLAVCLCLLVGNCEAHPAWKQSPLPYCPRNQTLPPIKIAFTVISDIILVVLPFVVLADLKSSPVFRTRLLVIFSASVAMTVSSVVQSVSLFSPNPTFSFVGGLTETFVGLVVCNLSVVVPATIHLLGIGDGLGSPARRRSSISMDSENGVGGGRRFTPVDDDASASHRYSINTTFNTMDLRFVTSVPTTATTGSRDPDAQSVISKRADDSEEKDEVLKLQSLSHSEPSKPERTVRVSQNRSLPSLSVLMARWRVMDVDADADDQLGGLEMCNG